MAKDKPEQTPPTGMVPTALVSTSPEDPIDTNEPSPAPEHVDPDDHVLEMPAEESHLEPAEDVVDHTWPEDAVVEPWEDIPDHEGIPDEANIAPEVEVVDHEGPPETEPLEVVEVVDVNGEVVPESEPWPEDEPSEDYPEGDPSEAWLVKQIDAWAADQDPPVEFPAGATKKQKVAQINGTTESDEE